jgi:hypothetical protein
VNALLKAHGELAIGERKAYCSAGALDERAQDLGAEGRNWAV